MAVDTGRHVASPKTLEGGKERIKRNYSLNAETHQQQISLQLVKLSYLTPTYEVVGKTLNMLF